MGKFFIYLWDALLSANLDPDRVEIREGFSTRSIKYHRTGICAGGVKKAIVRHIYLRDKEGSVQTVKQPCRCFEHKEY